MVNQFDIDKTTFEMKSTMTEFHQFDNTILLFYNYQV
jgi:hypothetical protein